MSVCVCERERSGCVCTGGEEVGGRGRHEEKREKEQRRDDTLQRTATHCDILCGHEEKRQKEQRRDNTLQHTATHCNVLCGHEEKREKEQRRDNLDF